MDSPSGRKVRTGLRRYPLACYAVGIILVADLAVAVCSIIVLHMDLLPPLAEARLLRAHLMSGGFGMLGAAIAAVRKYYRTLITQTTATAAGGALTLSDWSIGWVYYYLTRPILGGVLGALAFTLSFVGVHVLASPSDTQISDEGRYLLFALAFVSGFAVSHLLDRLEELAQKIFVAQRVSEERED